MDSYPLNASKTWIHAIALALMAVAFAPASAEEPLGKDYAEVDGRKTTRSDPSISSLRVVAVDGRRKMDMPGLVRLAPGMHTLQLASTRPGRRGELLYQTITVEVEACMRYFLHAKHPRTSVSNTNWEMVLAKTEPRPGCTPEGLPIPEAEAFFGRYQSLASSFDPAAADLYCNNAKIQNVRRFPNGEQKTLQIPAAQYKDIVRTVMPTAQARGDTNAYSKVEYWTEGRNVRVTAVRFSDLKQYESPFSLLIGRCDDGSLGILEELTESIP